MAESDKMDVNPFLQMMDILDNNSRMILELTGIAKDIASKNPDALDGNFAEYFIKSSLGDKMYESIKSTYHTFLGDTHTESAGGGKDG